MVESIRKRVDVLIREEITLVPYDVRWPESILRIEHFGSTAVPGLAAKPIIDILVEVNRQP